MKREKRSEKLRCWKKRNETRVQGEWYNISVTKLMIKVAMQYRNQLTEKAFKNTRHWMMPSIVSPVRQNVPVRCLPLRPTEAVVARLACTRALRGKELPPASANGKGLAAPISRSIESMTGPKMTTNPTLYTHNHTQNVINVTLYSLFTLGVYCWLPEEILSICFSKKINTINQVSIQTVQKRVGHILSEIWVV